MDLRKLLKCPVTVALLILWAALSVVGYLGKDTIYKNYTVDIRTTPYFVLVFDGLHDGIFPWSCLLYTSRKGPTNRKALLSGRRKKE